MDYVYIIIIKITHIYHTFFYLVEVKKKFKFIFLIFSFTKIHV